MGRRDNNNIPILSGSARPQVRPSPPVHSTFGVFGNCFSRELRGKLALCTKGRGKPSGGRPDLSTWSRTCGHQAHRAAARPEDQEGPVRPSGLVARGGGQGTVVGLCAKCYKVQTRPTRSRPSDASPSSTTPSTTTRRGLPPTTSSIPSSRSTTRAAARELVLPLDATYRALSFL